MAGHCGVCCTPPPGSCTPLTAADESAAVHILQQACGQGFTALAAEVGPGVQCMIRMRNSQLCILNLCFVALQAITLEGTIPGGWPWVTEERRPFSIEGDGCKKMVHLRKAGTAISSAHSELPADGDHRTFFGPLLNSEGPGGAADLMQKAAADARARAADDGAPACAAQVMAARPTVPTGLASKDLDRQVSCTLVCARVCMGVHTRAPLLPKAMAVVVCVRAGS
jgi:hypothetical protein